MNKYDLGQAVVETRVNLKLHAEQACMLKVILSKVVRCGSLVVNDQPRCYAYGLDAYFDP